MIEIRLLGSPTVIDADGEAVAALQAREKQLALLAYLVLQSPRGRVRRDTLVGMFWPETDDKRARMSLKQAVYELRQQLGSATLVTGADDTVGLDPEHISSDVWTFDAAVAAGDPDGAVAAYTGPLLDGFHFSGNVEFEQLVERESGRLTRAYCQVLEQLVDRAAAANDHQGAVRWVEELAAQSPHSTHVALRVMRVLETAGDRAGALRFAESHATRLRVDLDAGPSPDVVAYAERLRERPAGRVTAPTAGSVPDSLAAALADRYTIERELSSGVTAKVFLAEDRKLRRRVAVKVLRPELAAVIGVDRFLREIDLTARLQHPNILPLYDSGQSGSFLYYVMPFVEGESLRDKLERHKQLPLDEVATITRSVAAALQFAHEREVIHRDIKPENILLHGGQALVSDFGIALALSRAAGPRVTDPGWSPGTPQYMSPEQATAGDLDLRTDVYSLGAVVYEMLTGEAPFVGKTTEAVVAKVVTTDPVPVETLRPGVPGPLARSVHRALSKNKADRQSSTHELASDVERGAAPGLDAAVDGVGTVRGSRWRMVAYGAVAVVALAMLTWTLMPGGGDDGPLLNPNRVAVAPFENETGDPALDPLGRYAQWWIAQGVQETEVLRSVPIVTIRPVVAYIDRQQAAGAADDPAAVLARETGAGVVVIGSYYLVRDSLQVQAQVIDALTGELVSAAPPVLAPRDAPDRVVEELRSHIMGGLAYRLDLSERGREAPATGPLSWEAYLEFDAGETFFHRQEFARAVAPLERAVALDSGHAGSWALLLLGMSHRNQGTDAGDGDTIHLVIADSLFQLAERRRDRLRPFERQFLDNGKAIVRGDYFAALLPTREQAFDFPRSLAPFAAGYLARYANRTREAIYWFESMDPDLPVLENWVAYWGHYRNALHQAGEFQKELEALPEFLARFPDRNVPHWEARALAAMGRGDIVLEMLHDQFEEDRRLGFNQALIVWTEYESHGYPDRAEAVLAEIVRRYQDVPDGALGADLNRRLLSAQGRWDEARQVLLNQGPGTGYRNNLNFKGRLGVLEARVGNRDAALAINDELATMDSPYVLGWASMRRARIAAVLGDKEEAIRLLEQAFREGLWYTTGPHTNRAFESLWHTPEFQEVMAPKDDDWEPPGSSKRGLLLAVLISGSLALTLTLSLWRWRPRRGT